MKYHLIYAWFVFPTLITLSYFSNQGKEIRVFLIAYSIVTIVSQGLLIIAGEKRLESRINRMAEGGYER